MRPTPPGYRSKLPTTTSSAPDTAERVLDFCRANGLISEFEAANIEEVIRRDDALSLAFEDLGDKDAYIRCNPDSKFTIGINRLHHRNRQRFSMAHEYAHYQLHRSNIKTMKVGEQILHRDGEVNPVERQANNFAAEILMPPGGVKSAMKQANNNIIDAANLLSVSSAALEYRLRSLGMIDG